jgi:uncharacterized protein DUF2834
VKPKRSCDPIAAVTSLLLHAAAGVATVVFFFYVNAHMYRSDWSGSRTTWLEGVYYATAIVSVCIGWYFNQKYVFAYPEQASWVHYTKQLFDTPAGGSMAQDSILANVVLFPLWTIIDGRRRGMRQPWIYFVMSLFTSFAFAIGIYLAAQERQLRWNARPT